MKALCLLILLASASNLVATPRGIRNNNPGNIRSQRVTAWPGAIGVDGQGHLIFRRPIDGIRAIVINLKAYRDRHGLRTPYGIVKRWTNGGDPKTQRIYARTISMRFNWYDPDDYIRLDMWDADVLEELTRGIISYECGDDPYEEELYRKVFSQK